MSDKKKRFDHETAIREVLMVGGFLLCSYGAWLIWEPLAFIVSGSALVYVGLPKAPRQRGGD